MHFASLSVLGLVSSASAYIIETFAGRDCTGTSRNVNVPNSFCTRTNFDARSLQVVAHGSPGQTARSYSGDTCTSIDPLGGPWKADGTDRSFQIGRCIDLDGAVARSYSSR